MPDARPPAVLLGGENIAVSAARSLASAGVRVHALGAPADPVRVSRACHEFVDVGAKAGVVDRFMEWLERGPRGAVVLPCADDGLELIVAHRAQLTEWGYLPVEADDDVLAAMLDKERTYELARRAGVPSPRTATVRTREEALAAAQTFAFPCALKPLQAHVFARHFGLTQKVFLVEDPAALAAAFERTLAVGVDMLVTEVIPGPDDAFCSYYSYLDEAGAPLFHFTKRKLRQWPVHFGLICYQRTCWEPEVAELGLRFFQGIGLRGVGNVEFKHDARDGSWKLIECNHRFTAANELVRHVGIDIPLLAYSRLTGLPFAPITGYRVGVHMWHPVEDLRALRAYRREGEWSLASWARSLLHRQHFPLWRADDPLPSVVSNWQKGRGALRKARLLREAAPAAAAPARMPVG